MTIPRIASYSMPKPSTLPSSKTNWLPQANRAVLLIHDMQEYFLDFFDREQEPIPTLLHNIRALKAACDVAGVPVVFTAQPAEQSLDQRGVLQEWWGAGVTAHPQRAAVLPVLTPHDGQAMVLDKWRYSAFQKSDLLHRMREQGRDQLIVCGVYAHIGCMLTVAEAFMNDIQTFMVGDAVADFSAEEHQMALRYVSQRCGVVMAQQAVTDALSGNTGLPLSLEALRAQVASVLQFEPNELLLDDNLIHAGLDSIRLMTLVERWQKAGRKLSFVQLGAKPTLLDWWGILQTHRGAV
jgi:bifunctional isochorismate lyase/aryl carrier protein